MTEVAQKLGVDEIKKALKALCAVSEVAESVIVEQGGALKKLSHLVAIGDDVVSLLVVKWPQVVAELKDIDAVERQELLKSVAADLDLKNDNVEAAIEKGLEVAVELGEAVAKLIGFAKTLKPAQA